MPTRQGFRISCPFHRERNPSCHISAADGRFNCFGCGKFGDYIDFVREVRGLPDAGAAVRECAGLLGVQLPASGAAGGQAGAADEPTVSYVIRDVDGDYVASHDRFDDRKGGKRFRWRQGNHLGLHGIAAADVPLFGVELLKPLPDGARVFVTEGEKAALALMPYAAAVGTVTGAASCPSESALRPLARFEVVLWPDADDAGRRHMERIAHTLNGLGQRALVLKLPPDAPPHSDADDYVAAAGEALNLERLIAGHAVPFDPSEHSGVATAEKMAEGLERTSWLWPHWLPHGYVTLLAGEPGVGKSGVALALVKAFLEGRQWPDGAPVEASCGPGGLPGKVLWLETEDSHGILRDRLEDWHVDKQRVLLWGSDGFGRPDLDSPDIGQAIGAKVRENGVVLVVLDTLAGAHYQEENSANIRRTMQVLTGVAAREHVALLALHHLRKRREGEAAFVHLDRLRGSSAIAAAPRVVQAASREPSDENALRLTVIKSNLGEPPAPLLSYMESDGPMWGPAPAAPEKARRTGVIARARALLREALSDGPRDRAALEAQLAGHGISEAAMKVAKKHEGIAHRPTTGRQTEWFYPPDQSSTKPLE